MSFNTQSLWAGLMASAPPAPGDGDLLFDFNTDDITGLSNNDPVVSLASSVGSYNMSQSSSGKRGLYKTNRANGHPSIFFDNSDDGYDIQTLSGVTTDLTIAVVAMQEPHGGSANTRIVNATHNFLMTLVRNGNLRCFNNGAVSDATYGGSVADSVPHLAIMTINTTSGSKYYVDNVDITTSGAPNTMPARLLVGASSAAMFAEPFNGDLFRLMAWKKLLDSTERTALFNEMKTAYGIP